MIALPRRASPAAADAARPLGRALLRAAAGLLATWAERRSQRRTLLNMSDAMLKDIGLGRGDAYREGDKPFWRA